MLYVCAYIFKAQVVLQMDHYRKICILIASTPAAYTEGGNVVVTPNKVPTVSPIRRWPSKSPLTLSPLDTLKREASSPVPTLTQI